MTATDANSPQVIDDSLPETALLNGLGSIPSYAHLVSAKAEASSAGTSGACSAVAAGGCADAGAPQPLTVDLSLSGLLKLVGVTTLPPTITPPPDGLDSYNIVLGLTGPAAACTAGPDGGPGSNFTATQTPASGSVDIVDTKNGDSVIGGAKQISGNDVLSGLPASVLSLVLQLIPANTVDVTFTPGSSSGSGSGPQTAAAAGQLALQVGSTHVLSLVGGKVSCGANQQEPTQTESSSPVTSPSPVPSSTPSEAQPESASTSPAPVGMPPSSSSEVPLRGGIQSDEGRYVPASNDTPLWAGLVSGGVALAGGIALWRRRLRRS